MQDRTDVERDASTVALAGDWRRLAEEIKPRRIGLDGRTVSYVEAGSDGPALLLIHGFGGDWRIWLPAMPALARHHRVVAVDLPGFGASEPLPGRAAISEHAAFLDAFCSRVGLERPTVIGSSMGGLLAAELAIHRPERVAALVLAAPAGTAPSVGERARILPLLAGTAVVAAHLPPLPPGVARRPGARALMLSALIHRPRALPSDLAYVALLGRPGPGSWKALLALARHIGAGSEAALGAIDCPTLVVWGACDRLLAPAHARRYVEAIPGAELAMIAGSAHLPMVEQPDAFTAAVLPFLLRQRPASLDLVSHHA